MAQYRAVVVGCGGRAPAHIEAYRLLPEAEVVACCAPTGRRRDPLAERYGLRAYADAGEMIRAEQPDMVHLVTWPETRVALMTLVAELGVPLCTTEKPLATEVTDWRALRALEASATTRFAVCHQFRWQPDLVRCQQALAGGELGPIRFMDLSAGMNIAGQGTHTLNYGLSLNGNAAVTEVFGNAHGWDTSDPGHPGPVTTEAYLQFANGVRGLWVSGCTAPRCGDPATVWQHVRVAAYAAAGRVLYEEFGTWEIAGPNGSETGSWGGWDSYAPKAVAAQAGFHAAMFRWHEGGAEAGTSLRQSLHEWQVVLALYQSALDRAPVTLDGFEPATDLVARYRAAQPG